MKLSLAWIFDHIHGVSFSDSDPAELVNTLIAATCEIESYQEIVFDTDHFTLARCESITVDSAQCMSPEYNRRYQLPLRADIIPGAWYLISDDRRAPRWATYADWSSSKEGLLPALTTNASEEAGGWKEHVERRDVILDLDNKAITHRPDLWGHRGFAREIAALYRYQLTSEERLYADIPVRHTGGEYIVSIEPGTPCKRLAVATLSSVDQGPSFIHMAHRLARVDARIHDRVVDTTNYVMFDIGQPMHAFDRDRLSDTKIAVTYARSGEHLALLDGTTIELAENDLVIRNGIKPIALAGIMGGSSTAVSPTTRSLVIEAGTFDPTTIRKSSAAHKKRTEASARFEKSLDPHANTLALLRFIRIMSEHGRVSVGGDAIISRGELPSPTVVTLTHDSLARRIGLHLTEEAVVDALKRLEFGVVIHDDTYTITIPSFRATKDITAAYDCIEEVARLVGYGTIPSVLPIRPMAPYDLTKIRRMRMLKELCAGIGAFHEISTYALIDEEFLARLGVQLSHTLALKNPLSERARRLVPSLCIHLMKYAAQNVRRYDEVRFFEINTTWHMDDDGSYKEERKFAGIIAHAKEPVDFYAAKALCEQIFFCMGIRILWQKSEQIPYEWMNPHQTAVLYSGAQKIGYAGMVDSRVYNAIAEGAAFCFELSVDALIRKPEPVVYEEMSRYQPIERDVSLFIPRALSVAQLEEAIALVDARIRNVLLIDMFEKDAWPDRRAVTLRITLLDHHEPLTTPVVEEIWSRIIRALSDRGGVVR
jgi:phenylalanyl-tRNA synthetase beta chain